jgi:hypothetical protein
LPRRWLGFPLGLALRRGCQRELREQWQAQASGGDALDELATRNGSNEEFIQ